MRAGLAVLLDDRAGVKFKDADLIAIPFRVTVGKKITVCNVELFDRAAKASTDVKLSDVVGRVSIRALNAPLMVPKGFREAEAKIQ